MKGHDNIPDACDYVVSLLHISLEKLGMWTTVDRRDTGIRAGGVLAIKHAMLNLVYRLPFRLRYEQSDSCTKRHDP